MARKQLIRFVEKLSYSVWRCHSVRDLAPEVVRSGALTFFRRSLAELETSRENRLTDTRAKYSLS